MSVGVVVLDLLVPGILVVRDTLLHGVVEEGVFGTSDAGRF